ncbi:hypothetical protein [Streptomyces jumonjinensis]|uniref:Uncharacterized protein n=1 Tax=Streptomyces jumonjinensis TaxID=1945 RepID=A0A646KRV0_STRJU|nr:hypothetical protein [Streptomyces jumonjinensis]MQT04830.1 hypothetical protein [Streptomyces jumonjinensis]
MSTFLTPDERVARLREQLSGTGAGSREGRRLRQSPAANVLIGTLLHGAARREQGLELTPLEKRLTDQFAFLFGQETLAEFGRVYAEPASRAGADSLFPPLITRRSLREGVGVEDVRALLPAIDAEVADLPTVRRVTVEDLGRGVLTGEENVVVVTGAPVKGTEFEVDDVYEARVRFVKFRCDRESGEEGRDEIYWMSAAAGDTKAQIVVLSPEYGGISTGTVRDFGTDAYLFKGAAEKFMAGNIQVWEADHSSPNEVRQVLADIARTFAEAALEEGPTWEAVFLALVAAASALVNWIMSLNKDDFVAEKTVAYTRAALARMAATNGGRSDLVFDGGGGGKHTLTIEVSFGPVIATGLSHSIFYNDTWSTPVKIPHLVSASRPSMTTLRERLDSDVEIKDKWVDTLYVAYKDSSHIIQLTHYDGEHWAKPLAVRDDAGAVVRANSTVNIGTHNGQLFLTWVSSYRFTARIDPRTARLVGPVREGYVGYSQECAFITVNGAMTMVWIDNRWIRISHMNPDNTQGWYDLVTYREVNALGSPAAVVFKGRIWVFYPDRVPDGNAPNSYKVVSCSLAGTDWRPQQDHIVRDHRGTMPPHGAVAAYGVHDFPRERIFLSGHSPQAGYLSTHFFDENGSLGYDAPRGSALHGIALAWNAGTLHRLHW